ncbi:hypothetical protein GCM10007385_16360 [Tateyamaria omphalii]|uniref:class I SAM-dependent methyltransferase n=1 Tax=Tateyamaria omphalii TaxID=299262 RepID=UPI001676CBBD|nr:class I SAM-dependent methyltransferase [Tateyamaria omphalii]GGX48947.1 hypothetical protein GCM10007385_16360 [Tateyamaria omphalii]
MLTLEEIQDLHAAHVQPGFGTTTPDELLFLQSTIHRFKPKRFLEIGTASGLTTGFIARFTEDAGGNHVTTLDTDTRFFGDHSKPVGYLASEIYSGDAVKVHIETGKSSLDLSTVDGPWDMAFVDADHAHPWPTLDTLAVAAHLTGPRIVLHHDLQLFRRHLWFRGTGPRALFNETPEKFRHAHPANGWNMFYIDLNMPDETWSEVAANALCMPWTARPSISRRTRDRFHTMIQTNNGIGLANLFSETVRLNRWSLARRVIFAIRFQLAKMRNP